MNTAEISAISRHRIGVDGYGVVTLVIMNACPLRCRYCLNLFALEGKSTTFTPESLLERVQQDNLYFLATGGGVTFGGGEPLLQADFIKSFCSICNPEWNINIETSLNVPLDNLKMTVEEADTLIIDIKDMNNEIYHSYTGMSNGRVVENLRYLSENGYTGKCLIRLPLIPSFNKEDDVTASEDILKGMGFTRFNRFKYKEK